MSQVVIVDDNLKSKRLQSKKQEAAIDKHSFFKKWQKSDISKPSLVLKLIGIAVAPIVLFWTLIGVLMSAAITLCVFVFKMLSNLIPRSKVE